VDPTNAEIQTPTCPATTFTTGGPGYLYDRQLDPFERIISGLGLEPFGVEGDDFDPRVHEALMHSYDDEVDRPVAKAVLQVGYRLGERILRPARVAVVEPAGSSDVPLDPTSLGDDVGSAADQPADAGAADDENNDEGR
jgi:molecular chaperone GrpE